MMNTPQTSKLARFCTKWLLHIIALLLLAWLGILEVQRVSLRWEYYLWSEAPFMTNMLKLHNGESLYSSTEDANSSVYSPGLEYITYATLAPFSHALDIRYARGVTIGIGILAAIFAAICSAQLAGVPVMERIPMVVTTTCVATLLISRNFTSDVPHPDNLHMLYLLGCLWLCYGALRRQSFIWAVLAMGVATLGIFAKQTAVLVPIGVALTLIIGKRWKRHQIIIFLLIGIFGLISSLAFFLVPDDTRFWTFELLRSQDIQFLKLLQLPKIIVAYPYRFALYALTVPTFLYYYKQKPLTRPFLLVWSILGAATLLPALAAHLKDGGWWNGYGIIDLWAFVLVWSLWGYLAQDYNEKDQREDSPPSPVVVPPAYQFNPIYIALVLAILVYPIKKTPPQSLIDYGENLEQVVAEDVHSGKSVWVLYGDMVLINNGITMTPLDRLEAILELQRADYEVTLTRERIQSQYYDRIYLNSNELNEYFRTLAKGYYREVDLIERPLEIFLWELDEGFFTSQLIDDIYILEACTLDQQDCGSTIPDTSDEVLH